MVDEVEVEKEIQRFVKRAKEIDKVNPLVAFYTRNYAANMGLKKVPNPGSKLNATLISVIEELEASKAKLELDKSIDHLKCEEFALRVFNLAKNADQAGKVDLGTAKNFFAASIFIEVMQQFSDKYTTDRTLPKHLKDKLSYAQWKAYDIRKAIKEGRTPQPGGPADWQQQQLDADVANDLEKMQKEVDREREMEQNQYEQTDSGIPPVPSAMDNTPPPQTEQYQSYDDPPSIPQAPPVPYSYQQQQLQQQQAQQGGGGGSLGENGMDDVRAGEYRTGQHVLYQKSPGSIPQEGVVASRDDRLYKVALTYGFEDASGHQLAPHINPGSPVLYIASNGQTTLVNLARTDISTWPPRYIVRLPSGQEFTVQTHQLAVPEGVQTGQPAPIPTPPSFTQFNPPPDPQNGGQLYGKLQQDAMQGVTKQNSGRAIAPRGGDSVGGTPPPPANPPPVASKPLPPAQPTSPVLGMDTLKASQEAVKQAKYAISSLNFDDIDGAIVFLKNALKALENSKH